MPKKMMMSLTLTPITDRFLAIMFGVDLSVKHKVAEELEEIDIYEFSEDQDLD